MHIGFFTYGMGEKLTGIGRYTVELSRALQALDPSLRITLLNPYPHSRLPWYQEFPNYPLPQLQRVPAAASLGHWQLHRAAARLELDILHDPCGIAPFWWPPLAAMRRYKRVTTIHDAIPLVTPQLQPLATRLIFRTLIPAARYSADAVITVSQAAAQDIRHYAGIPAHKLHVTPNGIRPEPTPSPEQCEACLQRLDIQRPYLLYVGNLAPRKNLARVLEAFMQLQQDSDAPEAALQLVIVGPASWRAHETFALAEQSAQVRFTDYVSDEDLQVLYHRASALVFPSLYEGFGLPVLEAMQQGTPVITSNTSSLPEVAGDAALLVDPEDSQAIAAAVRRIISDPAYSAALVAKGRERVKQFSWQTTASLTLELYQQLCKHNS